MEFHELGLIPSLTKGLKKKNYQNPTPIQEQAIPPLLGGKDLLGISQTGTGKTAAFTLPLLQRLSRSPRAKSRQMKALILAPTRELAQQIDQSVKDYGAFLNLRSHVVFGGVKINPQIQNVKGGVEILVATPGRLLDLYEKKAIYFEGVEFLILDEVDRILGMGFKDEVDKILSLIKGKPQTICFSATLSPEVKKLTQSILKDPVEISVEGTHVEADNVDQWVYPVDKVHKPALFIKLIQESKKRQILVFTRTKNGANKMVLRLEKAEIKANAIHGDKSQASRTRALEEFKSGKIRVLIATDLAARGIDINRLPLVINYDLPHLKEDYIHRIGRTGRADASGEAYSLVCQEDFPQLADIERLTKQIIPRRDEGMNSQEPVPPSTLDLRPFKAKKPKKPKKKKSST